MKNIRIHLSNYLILYFLIMFFCGYIKNAIYIFIIIFIHEMHHIICAIILKCRVGKINLYPFGGISEIDIKYNDSFIKCFLIGISGIIGNLLLFLIKDSLFYYYNKMILIFNLFPIYPLDGQKILFEFLNKIFSFRISLIISIIFSFVSIIIFYIIFKDKLTIMLLIYKTYEFFKERKTIFNKFILERIIYNFKFKKKRYNVNIKDYHKNIEYLYLKDGKYINEKEYLKSLTNTSNFAKIKTF